MTRLLEILVFSALALVAHLLFALDFSQDDGLQSGGAGGEALLTLAAAPPQIETMVETWNAPPETSPSPVRPTAPVQPPSPPVSPSATIDTAPLMPGTVALPSGPKTESQLPKLDTSTPTPPRPKAEVAKTPPPKPEPKKTEQKRQKKPKPATKPAQKKTAEKAKKAKKSSAGQAAQKAAGSGGGSVAGQGGKSKVATLGKGKAKRLITVWGGRIRAKIERSKRYPRGVKKRGRVVLRLSISPAGTVRSVSISRSSGNAALDKAAIAAVRRAGRMPRAPKGLTDSSYRFNLPVSFQ